MAEVYNSDQDDGIGGLSENGSALPVGISSTASDHYAVFVDIFMQDDVVQPTFIVINGADEFGVQVQFESLNNHQYSIEFSQDLSNANSWTAVTNFVNIPGTGEIMIYADDGTGTPSPPGIAPAGTIVSVSNPSRQLTPFV